ncbi:MAG: zinc ribbon domain-containing protein [Sinobacteraceae bacterium]|nr:zinc ribbon domain-containing protein [Nevskiaceae bacterium]
MKEPFLPGWFTLDAQAPHLIGTRCAACGTYYFPKETRYCRNPDCQSTDFEQVLLSRTGRLWSYTDAAYPPPPPFVAPDPYRPFAIAAVELEKEKMIVLGPVADGVGVEALRVGMAMALTLEPLADGKLTWKWRPA